MTGCVPAWAAFLVGFLVLLGAGSFGVWLGFGLGLEHAERPGPEWTAAELEGLASDFGGAFTGAIRRPPVEVAHERHVFGPAYRPDQLLGARFDGPDRTGPLVEWEPVPSEVREALALANSGSDEERVAAAMADLDVFMTRLLADHPEEGP